MHQVLTVRVSLNLRYLGFLLLGQVSGTRHKCLRILTGVPPQNNMNINISNGPPFLVE